MSEVASTGLKRGSGGHDGNQLGFGGGRRRWGGNPARLPPEPTLPCEIGIPPLPIGGRLWRGGQQHLGAQVTDQRHGKFQRLSWMIREGQRKAGARHLARHYPVAVPAQRDKVPDLSEGSEPLVLVGVQDG